MSPLFAVGGDIVIEIPLLIFQLWIINCQFITLEYKDIWLFSLVDNNLIASTANPNTWNANGIDFLLLFLELNFLIMSFFCGKLWTCI